MKIAYEPHPVTPERKRELRDQGYKIMDIRFAPEGQKQTVAPMDVAEATDNIEKLIESAPARRLGRPRKVTGDADS